ncbi:hypothetical protein PR048_010785, partial [Dryococelus australis]
MAIGIAPLPNLLLYWSTKSLYHNELMTKTMKRERFEALLNCFHFSNNDDLVAETDRLFKIRDIVEQFCRTCADSREEVVIDKTMVPWRERLLFRQYIPTKAHKYGVKVYKVSTAEVHRHQVVMELMTGLTNEGRILYTDNCYSSVQLVETLLQEKTYLCGTLRVNRKCNTKIVCQTKQKRGDVYGEEKAGIKVIKLTDKMSVLVETSVPSHTDELIQTGKQNKNGEE